jgi:hypothetical protein
VLKLLNIEQVFETIGDVYLLVVVFCNGGCWMNIKVESIFIFTLDDVE